MEYQDYYKILGVSREATADEIKKQYRRLARKYHPDVSKEANAEEMFKKVKEAYEVLKDPEKRQAYNQMGSQWKQGQGFQPPPGWNQHHQRAHQTHADPGEFSDFFESIFGRGFQQAGAGHRGRTVRQKGQDQHSKIAITLQEAFHGGERSLTLREPSVDAKTQQVSYQTRQVNVKIPPGVTEGQQIRLTGLGSPGAGGGPNGDIYLEVGFLPHPFYTVEGRDIYLKLPITPWEAALGTEVEIPTLAGSVKLKIAAGAQSGQKMRLKGRGLPGKPAGDEYVLLTIFTPKAENAEQTALYQKMKDTMNFNPRHELFSKE